MLALSQWSKTKTKASAGWEAMFSTVWDFHFFLLPETLLHSEGSCCEVGVFKPLVQFLNTTLTPFFPPFAVSDTLCSYFFFPALAKCLPVGYNVRSCHSPQSGLWSEREDSQPGPALLCAPRPHPPNHTSSKTLTEHPHNTDLCTDNIHRHRI